MNTLGPSVQNIDFSPSNYMTIASGEKILKRIIDFDVSYDLPFVFAAAATLFTIRLCLIHGIFKKFGQWYNFQGVELKRFEENFWFAFYYTLQTAVGLYLLKDSVWIYEPDAAFTGYPHLGDDYTYLRAYYLVQCGFYLQAIFGLLFVDEKMKDFNEMVTHHFATLILVAVSLIARYIRFGSYVLIVHDIVDVILYNGKVIHYLKFEKLSHILLAVFILFGLGFLRLIYFPYLISFSFLSKGIDSFSATHYLFGYLEEANPIFEISSYGICVAKYCVSSFRIEQGFLCVLVCLHIYWFSLACKVAYRTIIVGKLEDAREHSIEKKKK